MATPLQEAATTLFHTNKNLLSNYMVGTSQLLGPCSKVTLYIPWVCIIHLLAPYPGVAPSPSQIFLHHLLHRNQCFQVSAENFCRKQQEDENNKNKSYDMLYKAVSFIFIVMYQSRRRTRLLTNSQYKNLFTWRLVSLIASNVKFPYADVRSRFYKQSILHYRCPNFGPPV